MRGVCEPDNIEYKWRERDMAKIDYWHTMMPYIGTRKLAKQPQKDGFQVDRKLVRRLMEEVGELHITQSMDGKSRNAFALGGRSRGLENGAGNGIMHYTENYEPEAAI